MESLFIRARESGKIKLTPFFDDKSILCFNVMSERLKIVCSEYCLCLYSYAWLLWMSLIQGICMELAVVTMSAEDNPWGPTWMALLEPLYRLGKWFLILLTLYIIIILVIINDWMLSIYIYRHFVNLCGTFTKIFECYGLLRITKYETKKALINELYKYFYVTIKKIRKK